MANESPVVAILDSEGSVLLDTVVNIGASVSPSKTFSRHSLENRQVVIDDQYDNPTLITLRVILSPEDYLDVYKSIKSLYEQVTSFTIQTKVDTYPNMYLEGIPHEEDPNMFNTISMNLELTEQLIVASSTEKLSINDVSNAGDSDSVDSGVKNTVQDDGTVLSRLGDRISSFF